MEADIQEFVMAAFMGGALFFVRTGIGGNMIDYSQTTVGDLYHLTKYEYNMNKRAAINRARAWIMAENIMEIRNLVIDWFKALDAGSVKYRLPNPLGSLSQNEADKIIQILDSEFDMEFRTRSAGLSLTAKTELFNRLEPSQRLAMAQAIKATKKTKTQIAKETRKRLNAGETIPPDGWTSIGLQMHGMVG